MAKSILIVNSTSSLGIGYAPIYAGSRNFPGKILYAVKTNPHEKVLKQIKFYGKCEYSNYLKKVIKLKTKLF